MDNKGRDPGTLPCFVGCRSCTRCEVKGSSACPNPWGCSGRPNSLRNPDPHDRDDYCRCKEGILQWRHSSGRLVINRLVRDPFAGTLQQEAETEDERDWNQYLNSEREKYDDPDFDPVTVNGRSATNWHRKHRGY